MRFDHVVSGTVHLKLAFRHMDIRKTIGQRTDLRLEYGVRFRIDGETEVVLRSVKGRHFAFQKQIVLHICTYICDVSKKIIFGTHFGWDSSWALL